MRVWNKRIQAIALSALMAASLFSSWGGRVSAVATNLALGKTATSSGTPFQEAALAVDGNTGTRWESQPADPQWLQVDLGAVTAVSRVVLNWEAAYGKAYTIEASADGINWTTVHSTTASDGAIDDLSFTPVSARYVKMNGTQRATQYSYSLWEFEVYGTETGVGAPPVLTADTTQNTVGQPIELTFTDNPAWRSNIASVKVDGTTIGSGQYSVAAGKITLSAALFTTAKTYTITVAASGYSDAAVPQAVTAASASANLALNKPATASANPLQAASLAVDGNAGTRWESQPADPQWLQVDLGAVTTVSRVLLNWEAAYGKAYTIQTSADGTNWTTAYSTTTGDGATDDLSFTPVSARYVKMNGTQRGTQYSYSLWELEVYGSGDSGNGAGAPTGLAASSNTVNSASVSWNAAAGASGYNLYRSTSSTGTFSKLNSSVLTAVNYADTGLAGNTAYYYKVSAVKSGVESALSAAVTAVTLPDFGPNVYIFDPSMPASAIQATASSIFATQEQNQFGNERYALLFKPGTYNANVRVGYYTQVAGLGSLPDDVTINGGVTVDANWMGDNATLNFWRSAENLSIAPSSGDNQWAVAQAAPLRRVHIKGSLSLFDQDGWSSGGFLADSLVDSKVTPGSQQQWLSRNSKWSTWTNGVWNHVFVGSVNPPSGSWPDSPYTVVAQTPAVREKPFLYVDGAGKYQVFVPALRTGSQGTSWADGAAAGTSLPIDKFYIARPDTSSAASINAALAGGKHLIFTPGVYHLTDTIHVNNANTVVLGLGFATLMPENGVVAMAVADVDGVKAAGLLFDAGAVNSPVLMEVGPAGSAENHAANPTSLSDIFFRVGGAAVGKADVSLKINSNNVIGDHFWIWRADHGTGAAWNTNTTTNGLIVNGNNVTIYGLFVEHYHNYQTLWNGNGGRTYMYQSEIPYDVPSQSAWMNGPVNGFASYKVANTVTTHEAWGLGVYSYFRDAVVALNSAIEVPNVPGVKIHHATSVFLSGNGEITHIVNNTGAAATVSSYRQTLTEYP
ncbi:discoidin domain-containing protein [Paenibacillus sp. S150]|uniref:discoidin domain-containing protein n=1 Tax=Paenibacillus sp. S150 TaxID=2749826 RepID=UPI001C621D52|nr:discoidin domain-containing protein [Paenibacillus sp. S150]MBW4085400.1 discoidin domain-containing protein [Paenibacillus sp. S150]